MLHHGFYLKHHSCINNRACKPVFPPLITWPVIINSSKCLCFFSREIKVTRESKHKQNYTSYPAEVWGHSHSPLSSNGKQNWEHQNKLPSRMVIYGHDHTDSLGQPCSDLPPYQQGLFNRPDLSNQPEALWRQTYPAWSIPKRQPGKPELTQRRFRGHLSGCLDRLGHAGKGHAPRECPCTIGMAASRLGMHSECTICASLTCPFCTSARVPQVLHCDHCICEIWAVSWPQAGRKVNPGLSEIH